MSVTFDLTIRLGDVITVGGVLLGVFGAALMVKWTLDDHSKRIGVIEEAMKDFVQALISLARQEERQGALEQRVARIENQ